MRLTYLLPILFKVYFAYGFFLFEPSIECTVIKVNSTVNAFGFGEFPKLHQSINNDPFRSVLHIADKKFPTVKPKTTLKTENFEKISITMGSNNIELQLNGKPISRNGTLSVNGKLLAKVTCH